MNNEPAASHRQSLDERFAPDPGLRQRLHEIADLRDALIPRRLLTR